MIAGLPTSVSADHRLRLNWFAEHRGDILPLAAVQADGVLLTTRAKGIYKPKDWEYSLSIRIVPDGPYEDGGVQHQADGTWTLRYFQEGSDPANRNREATNRGLMACIRDGIPVGVLQHVGRIGNQGRYEVLGLAQPVRWTQDGYFHFESVPQPQPKPEDDDPLLADAQVRFDALWAANVPDSDEDARERVAREVVARRGQSMFRTALIIAYQGRCAITGCDALPVLDAAHLRPYRGPATNVVTNGLLLRTDIHSLLDQQLLAPEPDTRVIRISRQLVGTQYEELQGRPLATPVAPSQQPTSAVLGIVWQTFQLAEQDR